MNDNNIDGKNIFFMNDIRKESETDCPYNELLFVVENGKLVWPKEDQAEKKISSTTVNNVQTVSDRCICDDGNTDLLKPNLSQSEGEGHVDKKISNSVSKVSNSSCFNLLNLSIIGIIIGVAIAIFSGVTLTPVGLGMGIALVALSVCVIIREVVKGCP